MWSVPIVGNGLKKQMGNRHRILTSANSAWYFCLMGKMFWIFSRMDLVWILLLNRCGNQLDKINMHVLSIIYGKKRRWVQDGTLYVFCDWVSSNRHILWRTGRWSISEIKINSPIASKLSHFRSRERRFEQKYCVKKINFGLFASVDSRFTSETWNKIGEYARKINKIHGADPSSVAS